MLFNKIKCVAEFIKYIIGRKLNQYNLHYKNWHLKETRLFRLIFILIVEYKTKLYYLAEKYSLKEIKKQNKKVYTLVKEILNIDEVSDFDSFNNEYGIKLENYLPTEIDIILWEILRIIFTIHGFLYLSHICKEKSYAYNYNGSNEKILYNKFVNYIALGEYDTARELIYNFTKLNKYKKKIYRQANDILLMLKKNIRVKDDYGDYLNNKRIFILGPARSDIKIDNYLPDKDVIVRINYMVKEKVPDNQKKYNTNISYYNGEMTRIRNHVNEVFDELDYECYRSKFVDDKLSNVNKRRLYVSLNCFTISLPLMGQLTLLDILSYTYDNIYIYGYNLYLDTIKYNDSYINFKNVKREKYHGFAMHDIEFNFNLMKSLYKKGFFKCDDTLHKVLSLSAEEYMRQLEKISILQAMQ